MIVWVSLVVALASSLVACFAKLKRPSRVKRWSRHFLRANRLVVISALLAILGFVVAGLGVLQDQAAARLKQSALEAENRTLQALLLYGNSVAPAVTLIVETGDPDLEAGAFEERSKWASSLAASDLPRTLGFLPSRFRNQLFPNSKPGPLLKYMGDVDIRTGRPSWRFNFRVREDGSIKAGLSPFVYEEIRVDLIDGAMGSIFLQTKDSVDAMALYHSIVRSYEEGQIPLRVRSFGANRSVTEKEFIQRRARLRFFLDDVGQISITAMLRGSGVEVIDDAVTYEWMFSEAPHLDLSLPGGRK